MKLDQSPPLTPNFWVVMIIINGIAGGGSSWVLCTVGERIQLFRTNLSAISSLSTYCIQPQDYVFMPHDLKTAHHSLKIGL